MLGMSFAELQQQLKGEGCGEVSRPIKIERHRPMVGGAAGMMFPSSYPYSTPDMTGLYINPNSPYGGMSPLSTSPVNMGGGYNLQ